MGKVTAVFLNNKIVVVFFLTFIVLTIIQPFFFTSFNISNILIQIPHYGFAAMGLLFVLISGHLDISMGAIMAFSSTMTALIIRETGNVFLAILITLFLCMSIGFVTGIFTSLLKCGSFIVSLCTMIYVRGIALSISNQRPIVIRHEAFSQFSRMRVLGIPLPFIVFLFAVVLIWLILTRTTYGRSMYALGGNIEVAKAAGIETKWRQVSIFILYGLLSGIGGIFLASRMSGGIPIIGVGAPLRIIPMLILGGASLSGGKGNAIHTLFGCAFLIMIFNAMGLYNVPANLQELVQGIILLSIIVTEKLYENRDVKV